MHYRKREQKPKVSTDKIDIDYRLVDMLDIVAKRRGSSRSRVFEEAILEYCENPNLPLKIKTKVRKKFYIRERTLELLLTRAWELQISKTQLINKALKEFLVKRWKHD